MVYLRTGKSTVLSPLIVTYVYKLVGWLPKKSIMRIKPVMVTRECRDHIPGRGRKLDLKWNGENSLLKIYMV